MFPLCGAMCDFVGGGIVGADGRVGDDHVADCHVLGYGALRLSSWHLQLHNVPARTSPNGLGEGAVCHLVS